MNTCLKLRAKTPNKEAQSCPPHESAIATYKFNDTGFLAVYNIEDCRRPQTFEPHVVSNFHFQERLLAPSISNIES